MQVEDKNKNFPIPYRVLVSRRARRIRISIGCDAQVVVTLPWGFKEASAKEFIEQKQRWILKSLEYFRRFGNRVFIKSNRREYLNRKQEALALAQNKVLQWNGIYGHKYNRITVKNQTTRWGSCSKKGNLNFNYKIIHLPGHLVDYLAVHELCHLKEFNHSKNFWALVGQGIPNYKNLRRQLRDFGVGAS